MCEILNYGKNEQQIKTRKQLKNAFDFHKNEKNIKIICNARHEKYVKKLFSNHFSINNFITSFFEI